LRCFDPPCVRVGTSSSRSSLFATSSASSLVPIDASAPLTACSGCACEGCGRGGGRRWCWFSRRPSPGGIAVSERTVSRYLPDRTRGRSQTWRTFLRNHVGAISCHAVVASSERPGDEDVVDTGLFSLGLTQPSGTGTLPTARRLPKALPRFNARLLARGMSWPDLHHRAGTGQFRPRSATVMCRFGWPKRVRAETPSSGCALRAGSTDSLRRFVRETCQIAIGNSGTLRARPALLN
jgi:hypothetical protein